MEDGRFGTLTSQRMEAGEIRRGLLAGLSASALAAVAARLDDTPTAAKKRKKHKKRKKKEKPVCTRCPKICESANIVTCKPVSDPDVELCVCAWTTTGNVACVDVAPGGLGCTATDECAFDGDCGPNQVCILVDDINCCPSGDTGNLCKPVCAT